MKRLLNLFGTAGGHYRTRYIIWYAIILHWVWAGTLMRSPAPMDVTAVSGLRALGLSGHGMIFVLVMASFLSAFSLIRDKQDVVNLVMLLPQQTLLILSANTALHAMSVGSFADGVVRPSEFMIADQSPAVIVAVFHACAVVEPYLRELFGSSQQRRKDD